jgi:hypothetical protein
MPKPRRGHRCKSAKRCRRGQTCRRGQRCESAGEVRRAGEARRGEKEMMKEIDDAEWFTAEDLCDCKKCWRDMSKPGRVKIS